MTDLIERLKAATKGSRELDAEICVHLLGGGAYAAESPFNGEWCVYKGEDSAGRPRLAENKKGDVPDTRLSYTTSLDAALTLVPEGYDWIVADVNGHVGGTPYACVGDEKQHFGETPCLSLCIAALKARETE